MRSRRALVAVFLVVVVLLVAGCGGDDDGGVIDASSDTTATTSTSAGGVDPMTGASTSPVSVPVPDSTSPALLHTVRASRHEGYDRVVFDFGASPALPGYSVSYVDEPVTADGSGERVDVAGDFVVLVRMEHASGVDLSKEDAPQTYSGPTRFDPKTPEVAELVRTGDFEAVLTWAIGVRDKVDFRVTTLTNPTRLVVDLRNH